MPRFDSEGNPIGLELENQAMAFTAGNRTSARFLMWLRVSGMLGRPGWSAVNRDAAAGCARVLSRVLFAPVAVLLLWAGAVARSEVANASDTAADRPPNIVVILADDLGYGDLSCLNPKSKIDTPHMDRLAREGMTFTDAHSPSAVCTPTRYGLLTGRYAWRTRLQSGVLLGFDRPLIESGRETVASFLKRHGYATAAVGKWHLGLGWQDDQGRPVTERDGTTNDPGVDYGMPITEGPLTVGFDYFFGISASLDMAPYCYIENDRVVQPPTLDTEGEAFPRNWRRGKRSPDFRHEEVLRKCTEKAEQWLADRRGEDPERPLFLYFALTAPHTPVLPEEPFRGKSRAGEYGDFVVQTDWAVGRILETLDRLHLRENTLVIVTSDNGSTMTIRPFFAQYEHDTNYHFRGQKSDAWEGGHRVPFLARWPGRIEPGTTCEATICLTDLLGTFAQIVGDTLPETCGEDSFGFLPLLAGKADTVNRPPVVMHSINGKFAVRQGDWKFIDCRGSGGWSLPENRVPDNAPAGQLYNLREDVGEKDNLFLTQPDTVSRLRTVLNTIRESGRSRL
ncbi:MAG: arylsulfatase [Thermogutta sp.]